MPELPLKTRFAPSPTGEIHLGNLRTALFNHLLAAYRQGVFLLRIEDTDAERSRPEYTQALMQILRWLGLDWQEGPAAGGTQGPYQQSERQAIYAGYFEQLEASANTYPCFCSDTQLKLARKAQRAAGQPPRYPGTCAHLSADEIAQKLAAGGKPSLRFRVPSARRVEFDDLVRGAQRFSSDAIGDFIIRRSDGTPAFFFTNAIDDALMGVSHVLRGEDHLANTPRQLLLLAALGLTAPKYGHLSLLVGSDGSPLSKRHGSRSVRQLREEGFLPGAILNYLARLGHSYETDAYLDTAALARGFSLQRLGKAPARYDEAQLRYWQKAAVAVTPPETLQAWYRDSEAGKQASAGIDATKLAVLIQLVRDNIEMPDDLSAWIERLTTDVVTVAASDQSILEAAGAEFFQAALAQLNAAPDDFNSFAKSVGQSTGARGKQLFMPLRVALTGVSHGPEMARIWEWLGAPACRARLQQALNYCLNGAESTC
jgi:glutamyl-tRNA synthetase